jgi:hypothetical protein
LCGQDAQAQRILTTQSGHIHSKTSALLGEHSLHQSASTTLLLLIYLESCRRFLSCLSGLAIFQNIDVVSKLAKQIMIICIIRTLAKMDQKPSPCAKVGQITKNTTIGAENTTLAAA